MARLEAQLANQSSNGTDELIAEMETPSDVEAEEAKTEAQIAAEKSQKNSKVLKP